MLDPDPESMNPDKTLKFGIQLKFEQKMFEAESLALSLIS
jgi:hypothetical protein